MWQFDISIQQWSRLECIGYIPAAREGHAAALVGDVMYLFGGRTGSGIDLGDLAAFKISSRRWYTFQNMGIPPSPRAGHSMVNSPSGDILIIGGRPSMSEKEDQLQEIFVLNTSKIKYPQEATVSGKIANIQGTVGRVPWEQSDATALHQFAQVLLYFKELFAFEFKKRRLVELQRDAAIKEAIAKQALFNLFFYGDVKLSHTAFGSMRECQHSSCTEHRLPLIGCLDGSENSLNLLGGVPSARMAFEQEGVHRTHSKAHGESILTKELVCRTIKKESTTSGHRSGQFRGPHRFSAPRKEDVIHYNVQQCRSSWKDQFATRSYTSHFLLQRHPLPTETTGQETNQLEKLKLDYYETTLYVRKLEKMLKKLSQGVTKKNGAI